MIKRLLFSGIVVLFFASCGNNGNDEGTQTTPNDTTEIKTVKTSEISLSEFDSLAANFVGKEVTVTGIVDHVCKKGGKKLLLVDGDHNIHVFNDKRFDEALSGSKVTVTGIVEEEKVDSAYLAEKLNHEKETHADGTDADKENLAKMIEFIKKMQDSLKNSGKEYFANYSLKYVSLKEDK